MPAVALDLVCCTVVARRLAVLVRDPAAGVRAALPWTALAGAATLDDAVRTLVQRTLGRAAGWTTQVGAFGDGGQHPSGAALSVVYVSVVPAGTDAPAGHAWHALSGAGLGVVGVRQRKALAAALTTLRDRMDREPVAFRLLPPRFTLSDLQAVYELLLGRRLHKASFRRALLASDVVEPLDAWRSEGRGRPAQFYRHNARGRHRGIWYHPAINP